MDKAIERLLLAISADFSVDQAEYTIPGTYFHTVLPGVTSYSVVGIGGGQGGASAGGNGGNLSYVNNIPVTPGETLTVVVGVGGIGAPYDPNNAFAQGSLGGVTTLSRGGTVLLTTAYGYAGRGGQGGYGTAGQSSLGGGGGGAGGYAGNGGDGAYNNTPATSGTGGAGSGGGVSTGALDTDSILLGKNGGQGGGTGIDGQGLSGTAPANADASHFSTNGTPGSSFDGNSFGSGGGGGDTNTVKYNGSVSAGNGLPGDRGALRIIWPGDLRQFPSTRTLSE